MNTELVKLESATGVTLEARWDLAEGPAGTIVFCHPHPQQGGTMTAPLMHKVTKALVASGFSVLRFNFRGVGRSGGSWDGGPGEIDDVAAAVDHARQRSDRPLGLAGWSFGAATALAWQARQGDATPYAGIAPPIRTEYAEHLPKPEDLAPAARLFILGDRDQFISVDQLEGFADAAAGTVLVLKGSDHFFYFREEQVAQAMAEHFAAANSLADEGDDQDHQQRQ